MEVLVVAVVDVEFVVVATLELAALVEVELALELAVVVAPNLIVTVRVLAYLPLSVRSRVWSPILTVVALAFPRVKTTVWAPLGRKTVDVELAVRVLESLLVPSTVTLVQA